MTVLVRPTNGQPAVNKADLAMIGAVPPSGLEPLAALARSIAHASWFVSCGSPLDAEEIADAQAYVRGLGLSVSAVEPVADWAHAQATTKRSDWSPAWWEAEEAARRTLYAEAARVHGEEALLAALSAVTQAASDTVHGAAAVAAARQGGTDPAFLRVAAGSATQACYHAALALAGPIRPGNPGGDHPFAAKYRLFAGGRWPLGIVGACCFVF